TAPQHCRKCSCYQTHTAYRQSIRQLSSLASDCNHIDHVRTQLPYALTVGSVSLVAGTLSTMLGGGLLISFILLIVSLVLLYVIVSRFGHQTAEA
ncbi:MAG: hypothetical protein AAFP19_26250, partial [Bacteroidota bacterium]